MSAWRLRASLQVMTVAIGSRFTALQACGPLVSAIVPCFAARHAVDSAPDQNVLIMCLMLYVGTSPALPLESSADLKIERVEAARRDVVQWFSRPAVRFVGAHTGCSCGFPSVIAESAIEYYDGMALQSDDREADLRSVRALIEVIRKAVDRSGRVELYPVADGDESQAPKGVIEWETDALHPERFFFNERFMHVVRGA